MQHLAIVMFAALAPMAAAQGWIQRQPAVRPAVRGFHAYTYDLLLGNTVVFGGWNGMPLADTWEWNGTTWSQRSITVSPPARCCHALAHDLGRGRIVMFGGTDGSSLDLNDTWEYDGITWVQRLPANQPGPRREVRMAFDVGRATTLLFGGGVGGSGNPVFADTWEWDGVNWLQRAPLTVPPARWSQGITYEFARQQIVMFGGSAAGVSQPLADTWTWDGANWQQVVTASSPPATTRTALAYDVARQRTVLFGGEPNGGQTWVFSGRTWRQDTRTPAPPSRATFMLAHDILRSRTVLFGGYFYVDDTWEYEPGPVASWTAYGTGCLGTGGIPALQPRNGSLPLLGSTFEVELVAGATAGGAAISIGFSDQTWNGQPLPTSLAQFGMPGCSLFASPDALFFVSIVAGRGTLAWALPNTASLTGVRFFEQGFVIDPASNALGAVVSNAGVGVIGPL